MMFGDCELTSVEVLKRKDSRFKTQCFLDIQDSTSTKSKISTLFSRFHEFGILNLEFFEYSFAAF